MKKTTRFLCAFLSVALAFSCAGTLGAISGENPSYVEAAVDRQTSLKNPTLKTTLEGGIELYGEKSYGTFVEPCDGPIIIMMKVKNVSGERRYVRFDNEPFSGEKKITQYIGDYASFPQPNFYYLNPGEEDYFQARINFNSNEMKNASGKVNLPMKWTVYGYGEQDQMLQLSQTIDTTTVKVKSYTQKKIQTDKKLRTATLKGYLKNKKGEPIANTYIRVESGYSGTMYAKTNAKGYYSIKVMPHKVEFSGKWSRYTLTPQADGYNKRSVVVTPSNKKTITKNITLNKSTSKYKYKQTKKIDTKIQPYDLDSDTKGKVIATVPFHTLLPRDKTNGKRKLVVANPQNGKTYFTKNLPEETPYVDVSDDGKYVTVTSAFGDSNTYNAIIYDIEGNEVYRTPNEMPILSHYTGLETNKGTVRSMCARLSHNDNYLCYATVDGYVYMLDWKNNSILWSACVKGQVRTIDFSADNKYVYVTDGGGDCTSFVVSSGAKQWNTFVGTWGCDTEVTDKYIATTVKSDGYSLTVLNRKTGKKLWTYPVMYRGSGIAISPNQKYLWYGNDNGSISSVENSCIFDIKTGKLLNVLPPLDNRGGTAGMEASFSKDSKKIVVKNGRGFGIYDVKTGEELYSKVVLKKGVGDSLTFSLYASPDLKYIVGGFNDKTDFRFWGQLYFFKRQ
ncbi:MAG: PQQ-binding-like beta-propeller repeat protein [Lachnospiraceae bacterium]|nr:PQQ-binding-like beta-propeller repeat protein [Lachnospiraceae bacterium]